MIEVAIVISLVVGGIFGYKLESQKEVVSSVRKPAEWRPQEHQDGMLMCRTMCEKQVLSYDPLTGECECKGN